MKTTQYNFDQIAHFRLLLEQKNVPPDLLQEFYDSGALADLLEVKKPKKIDREAVRRTYGLPPLTPPLLESVGTTTIPATKRFIACDHFVVDTSRKARVKIAWLGENFKNQFLSKTEAPATEVKLDYAWLTRLMLDDEIRKEIGARREETTLAAIWALMERQPNGESGAFLTSGYANIFYVRDVNGAFWAVGIRWDSFNGGWIVGAHSVGLPLGWDAGGQVFSQVA